MKIRLAQINPIVGNFDYNAKLIGDVIQSSSEYDIIVFPELSLTGYPPQDLLLDSEFISQTEQTLESIKKIVNNQVVIIGFPRKKINQLFNSAAIINEGEIIGYHDKILLPTYDVFDENRYFEPGAGIKSFKVDINGKPLNFGVQICEDLWEDDYNFKITDTLIEKGAEMIINISASPYRKNILDKRLKLCRDKSIHLKYYFIYCNIVGAQDELVFDGRSLIMDPHGNIEVMGKLFTEDMVDFDTENSSHKKPEAVKIDESEELFKALSLGVKDYFQKSGFSKAVVGLSGGIDSSLTAAIAVNAIGKENVIGISMPSSFSSEHSRTDAMELAKNLEIKFETIPIHNVFNELLREMDCFFNETDSGLAEENLQARIRGNILMSIANKVNALVLNTGNKTELALGYCTMYGDMCGALGVISDINKQEVYSISRWINNANGSPKIPLNSINKRPSAELKENQYDPFDYDLVSPIVDHIINDMLDKKELIKMGYDSNLIDEIQDKIYHSEYKRRQSPPGIKVSSKAFGVGRRYPIINQYKGAE